MEYEEFIYELMDTEPAVFGGAVIDPNGTLLYQTENWDLQQDIQQINSIIEEAKKENAVNPGRIEIMKVSYMIVELTPERVIATNVTHKGHIIIAIGSTGTIVAYIDPATGPRDALFNVQAFVRRL